jgi:hypothetical protein
MTNNESISVSTLATISIWFEEAQIEIIEKTVIAEATCKAR